MATPIAPYYQLKCSCNQYPWGKQGSNSLAARLCAKTPGWDGDGPKTDFKIDENTPYAEMWMGTYPVLPSYVANTGEDLQDVLDRYPKELLGEKVTEKFGHTKLPFLPKVLSIAKALPLQVHPNKEFSARMHAKDPSNFTDPNHKPEIALALTEFEAFCGFKPLDATAALLNLPPLKPFRAAVEVGKAEFTNEDLRQVVQTMLEAPDEVIKRAYNGLRDLPDSAFTGLNKHIPQLAPRLAEEFPESDPGILVGLVTMNYMVLQTGESIYIPADGIHAYISGDIIECMARSDNVLNTGFCPKAERSNAKEFCSVLTFNPHDKIQAVLKAEKYWRSEGGWTKVFQPPLSEFNMLETRLDPGDKEILGKGGPSILLATKGGATVDANGSVFELSEGHVYFVAQGVRLAIEAKKDGLLMHTAYVE
ncbi:Fc.00g114150.m01.CDS01 [Cosmosporella sp. VM-42]